MKQALNQFRIFLFKPILPFWVFIIFLICISCNQSQEFSFIQITDTQLGFSNYEDDVEAFRQAVRQINESEADFVILTGDLVDSISEGTFQDFKNISNGLNIPLYIAPGNHDINNPPTSASLEYYRKTISADYFSFKHKRVTFIIANTQLWRTWIEDESEKHDNWFKKTIEDTGERPVIVAGHHPFFIRESNEEDDAYNNIPVEKRTELLDLMVQYNTIAYFAGHTHRYLENEFQGIPLLNIETTSLNFDQRSRGYRIWHISGGKATHEYIPLEIETSIN